MRPADAQTAMSAPPDEPHREPLTIDEMLAIKKLIADPIAESNEKANREMKQMLENHVLIHDKRLTDHEARIASLESVKRKALIVWSLVVMAATFIGKAIWDGWLKSKVLPSK